MNKLQSKWLVAQLGARMHYAVPRMLAEAGQLEHFYTDICAIKGWPRFLSYLPEKALPNAVRRLTGRVPHGIPADLITAFTNFGWEYAIRRSRTKTPSEELAVHIWAGKQFCEKIIHEGFGAATGIYTFNSSGLELMRVAKSVGLKCVMEQTIAPKRIEVKLLEEEYKRFPGWQMAPNNRSNEEFMAREEAEWQVADSIICGSDFVRDGLVQLGTPPERCKVVPYGVDLALSAPVVSRKPGPLRVLTVGQVGLRKGSPYVLEAAKALKGEAVFRMVGPIGVLPAAEAELRKYVELTGVVARAEIAPHYSWADVFLLPSICEGSATVTYEALSAGLPVICTPNTGSLVSDGMDGFIVPAGDSEAIVRALKGFMEMPEQIGKCASKAILRARELSTSGYSERLLRALAAGII